MSDDYADQRSSPRVALAPIPDHLPGWVFKPVQFSKGPAGLVLNISDGGLQVLIAADEPLEGERREVVLLLGQSSGEQHEDAVTWFNGIVEKAWSRPMPPMGNLHGLRFVSRNSTAEKFLLSYKESLDAGQWVRCVLLKVPG